MALSMARPFKHPKTGVYWFRKVVPKDLRAVMGKREELRTLRTKDPAEARTQHAKIAAEVDRAMDRSCMGRIVGILDGGIDHRRAGRMRNRDRPVACPRQRMRQGTDDPHA